ncbi:MAG: BioY protein [Evtepia sp.]|jgi:biotin transport system substrate-specific component|nr:BioY protein [Evtepia sp.]
MNSAGKSSGTRSLAYIALSVALIAVCSWIAIPTAIPFTMQTFAVFAVLGLLGGKRGTLAILSYLLLGLFGLPIFSGFQGGIGILLGSTGGYLVGFIVMGLLYWLLTKLLGTKPWIMALSMVLGLLLLYAFGSAWFLLVYTNSTGAMSFFTVLGLCVFPFLLPDLFKLLLALLLIRRLSPHLHL